MRVAEIRSPGDVIPDHDRVRLVVGNTCCYLLASLNSKGEFFARRQGENYLIYGTTLSNDVTVTGPVIVTFDRDNSAAGEEENDDTVEEDALTSD